MQEYREIARFIRENPGDTHEPIQVESLPEPGFQFEGRRIVSFSTNNYLSLATSPRLIAAAERGLRRYGVANCESRLLGGDLGAYREVESKLARLKRKDGALLFATGYLTNLGVLSSLPRAPQIARSYGFRPTRRMKYEYFGDELNHISIREGIRLSETDKFTYRHGDLDHLEAGLKKSAADAKIIVTDGVFSQDGDIAPLPALVALADRYDAIVYVDDAHGTGVLGPNGGGISEHFDCYHERVIHMGTLSKAYGAIGGFIAADAEIVEILRLACPAYGFTSTLPPDQAFAVSEAIDMVADEPDRRASLWANQKRFVEGLHAHGFAAVATETPIVPVLIGDEGQAEAYSVRLRQIGYHVDAVKFPAVGRGKLRLRFIMNARHSREDIDGVVRALASVRAGLPKARVAVS